MRAFIKFNKGILKMPLQWQLWLMLLMAANMAVPLFYLGHLEAKVVLGTFMASVMLFTALTARFGFTRILGFGHILWFPLLGFLALRLCQHPADDFFGAWLRALIVLNALSLAIDVADVVRYFRGDRKETVQGLSPKEP